MADRTAIPSEQRIFSLVLALVVSPQGVTKRELLSTVYGYVDRYRAEGLTPALDRLFERDKEQLRQLGIHVETLDSPLEPGNNQLTRYRIAKERLEFPAELRFSPDELVVLRLAALAWSEGSRSDDARRAVMKLEALGAGRDVQHLGVAPNLGTADPAAAPLQTAIERGVIVHFDYRLAQRESALRRTVAPLRLHRADGRWHLISWDLERDASRVFLLSRIEGEVAVTAKPFDEALRADADRAVTELLHLRDTQRALLRVRRGSVAEARLSARAIEQAPFDDDRLTFSVGVLDLPLFAEELVGYGADAAVVSPAALRSLVVGRLTSMQESHVD